MLFPSIVFLFTFLPIVLGMYFIFCNLFIVKEKRITAKNIILLISSLIFYAYGEGRMLLVLLFSIFFNWAMAICISMHRRKALLAFDVFVNLAVFFVFKYCDFFIENVNILFSSKIPYLELAIPLGISFFTFQAVSYVVDVYRGKITVQKNILKLGLYISFFPQLIAGPIVRYEVIEDEISDRKETIYDFSEGISRFAIGMSKKLLLADGLIVFYDRALMALEDSALSMPLAWLGAICYTMHIYFDFSGYSDMAIGLGRIFGFHFQENFNYPYISKSITEFWRRWHISLGTWFRDYIYIPLGGSRCSKAKYIINILIVWTLTGLWHGAAWTFVLWGFIQFLMLLLEKYLRKPDTDNKLMNFIHWAITFIVINISWMIFAATKVDTAFDYIKAMFSLADIANGMKVVASYIYNFRTLMIVSVLTITPLPAKLFANSRIKLIGSQILLLICVIYIICGGYSPFIYFNF